MDRNVKKTHGRYPWETVNEFRERDYFESYQTKMRINDVRDRAEQLGIDLGDGENVLDIVATLDSFLSKNDAYFEAYWQSVEDAIRAHTEVKNES